MAENSFLTISFRGEKRYMHKDMLFFVPYLESLVNGPLQGSVSRDETGAIMVDENARHFFDLVDLYRHHLENKHEYIRISECRGLYISMAKRLGFDCEFIKVLGNDSKKYGPDDLFKCVYCGNIYAHREENAKRECRYHSETTCKCIRPSRRTGCSRIPFHSSTLLDIADPPKVIS